MSSSLFAADPASNDPAAELASFKLAEGFEAQLWASEKEGVVKPIAIRWDARGRLWVIGSKTYPQIKPGEEPNDQVLILEDTDRDGRADKTTVFADGLMIPTGLEIASSGIFTTENTEGTEKEAGAAASPSSVSSVPSVVSYPKGAACYVGEGTKLWLMTDTDGDGKADRREVVLRGFGTGDNHQNLNSFLWSPGGELMFCQGLHAFSRVETPHGIAKLDEAGFFRFRPREMRLDTFYGGPADPQNPWGFAFTAWGMPLLVAGNNGGIFFPLPEMIRGHDQRRVGNIWKDARGRKTSNPDIVGTAHLPPEWQGTMLLGGYINNAVWALKIEDDGAGFRLTDLPPLLTSTHTAFRPIDVKIGPDGAIYVADWYNPIIGHYQSSFRHPDRDKTHGRIWRITYKGRPLVQQPPIADATVEELLENLKSNERWTRYQSKRVLASRPTEEVVKALRAWWPGVAAASVKRTGSNPQTPEAVPGGSYERALMEALGVFESHETPEVPLLLDLGLSKSAEVRAYLAGTLGRWLAKSSGELGTFPGADGWLAGLASDNHPRVRLAAVVASANLPKRDQEDGLTYLGVLAASAQPRDRFIDSALRQAVMALKPQWEPMLAGPEEFRWKKAWTDFLTKEANAPDPRLTSKGPTVDAKTREMMKSAAATSAPGTLRATPEFVAELVREVREKGDAARGAAIYGRAELACVACHSIAGHGGTIGPPLDAIGTGQPLDFIIGAVLEPQREVKEGFETLTITTKSGAAHTGFRTGEDEKDLTLREVATGHPVRIPRAEIATRQPAGSVMPAGLVDRLSREELRDLFAYLARLGKLQP